MHLPINPNAQVAIIMGSQSDWSTMKHASDILAEFEVPHDTLVVSAHRTPQWMAQFAQQAEDCGYQVIIAGAGGAAHLPGMVASQTLLPVLGVPVSSRHLQGVDSLLSIVQMPGGVPVGSMAIGESGAKNAGLMAVRILARFNRNWRRKLQTYQLSMRENVEANRVIE